MNKLNIFNNSNNIDFFGNWTNNINELNLEFNSIKPGLNNRFVIIKNFLNKDLIEKVNNEFPNDFKNNKNWFFYDNPLEVKYLNSNIKELPENIQKVFYALSTNQITNLFSKITDIKDLEYDSTLYGSSIHAMPRYGRLNLHLDYEKHPKLLNKERRLNIILYLNKEWKPEWNGDTELWNTNVDKCVVSQKIEFNSAIIFETNNISWHGVPEKILCPEGYFRKTLAYYYISPLTNKSKNLKNKYGANEEGFRIKAAFIKRPKDEYNEKLNELYKIRPNRRITKQDMLNIWPDWNSIDI